WDDRERSTRNTNPVIRQRCDEKMKNSILVGVLFIAAVMWLNDEGLNEAGYQSAPSGAEFTSFSDDSSSSFDRSDSNRQVQGEGVVVRTLPDDNDGSRHQRFILELPSGQTILIAHNIDLAPRIPS